MYYSDMVRGNHPVLMIAPVEKMVNHLPLLAPKLLQRIRFSWQWQYEIFIGKAVLVHGQK